MKTRFECLVAESASMNLLRSFTLGLTSFPFALILATNPALTDVPSVEVLVDFKLLQMVFSAFHNFFLGSAPPWSDLSNWSWGKMLWNSSLKIHLSCCSPMHLFMTLPMIQTMTLLRTRWPTYLISPALVVPETLPSYKVPFLAGLCSSLWSQLCSCSPPKL